MDNADKLPFTVEKYQFFKEKRDNLINKEDGEKEEIYDITNILQAAVIGAQLNGFQSSSLNVNPCIDENESPFLLMMFWIRGTIHIEEYHYE